ncbi:MAG TPA: CAP domain-containing protein [Actinomycetota bacterium]|nr:CAP domain-containing protein [Actinomycetota bacterium]
MPAVRTPARRAGVVSLLAAVALTLVPLAAEPATAARAPEDQMRHLINGERIERGKRPLVMRDRLVWLAREHSRKMANKGTIWHSRNMPEDLPWKNVYWGENVGMGNSVQSLHNLFMQSDGHRWNILRGVYDRIGVGVVYRDGRTYVTVLFVG